MSEKKIFPFFFNFFLLFGNLKVVWQGPEVEFVHAVSAGGSVKFLPAV